MTSQPVTIPGPHRLEGCLHLPAARPRGCVVVCHPHPLFGGNMDVPLVMNIAAACTERGLAALRFNFRGAGASEGVHSGDELAEWADAGAALGWLQQQLPPGLGVGLAGYSFGAVAAVELLSRPEPPAVAALALVGFPVESEVLPQATLARLPAPPPPLLLVAGEHDLIAASDRLQKHVARLGLAARVEVMPGADHFFAKEGRLVALLLADFLAAHL